VENKKILIWDIETSDLDADIGHIISIGYMWFGEKTPKLLSIIDYPGKTLVDDSRLIEEFSKVYEQADVTVAHFGQFFDLAFVQTKRLIHGMGPLPKVPMVDTWRIAKKRLKFRSNRLERILEVLGCPYSKSPVKLSVWALARCGDKNAIKYVVEHNRLDVLVLAWVYEKLRPFWEHHPALHTSSPDRICSICGSNKVKSKGRYTTSKHTFQLLRCFGCGHSWKGAKID
jgi:uncharacterized protein YprB with RNaseH-like and TPR domain